MQRCHSGGTMSSGVMASTGHASTHASQSMHSSLGPARLRSGPHETVSSCHRRERRMHAALAALAHGGEASGVVLDGDAATELAEASADLDLLALGSRGYGPVRSALLPNLVVSRCEAPAAELARRSRELLDSFAEASPAQLVVWALLDPHAEAADAPLARRVWELLDSLAEAPDVLLSNSSLGLRSVVHEFLLR